MVMNCENVGWAYWLAEKVTEFGSVITTRANAVRVAPIQSMQLLCTLIGAASTVVSDDRHGRLTVRLYDVVAHHAGRRRGGCGRGFRCRDLGRTLHQAAAA